MTATTGIGSLPHFIASLERLGRRTAFVDRGRFRTHRVSYAEAVAGARKVAAALGARGVLPGDRVLVRGEPSSGWAIAFWGCVLHGAVAVPLEASSTPEFVARVRAQTDARLALGDGGVSFDELLLGPEAAVRGDEVEPDRDRLLEVVYTSGTTSAPRGVRITHGNLLANLAPIAAEIARHERLLRVFEPLVFVHLIPLSHLFGQVMALFLPQVTRGTVVFERSSPERVVDAVRSERATVIVCVPQQLAALGAHVGRVTGVEPDRLLAEADAGFLRRAFRHRRVHRLLGLRFWACVVGGAVLPARTERLWKRLGFAVVQGYGLTETAPAVAVSDPFHAQEGAVGKVLPGVEVRIAEDGEVLVRGANVSGGYYGDEAATRAAFTADGWLRTGDLGRLDAGGSLVLRGRKKDVIVLPDGRNVHPEDVEEALAREPGVRAAAVVGRASDGRERVHAVLVVDGGDDVAAAAVGRANERLEPHQRVASFSRWPEPDLPRTATGKVRRAEVRAVIAGEPVLPRAHAAADPVAAALERLRPGTMAAPAARLDEDLALASLDRLELLLALEQATGRALDERAFAAARTVGDLARLVATSPAEGTVEAAGQTEVGRGEEGAAAEDVPVTPRTIPTHRPGRVASLAGRALRAAFRGLVLFPLLRPFVRVRVEGRESLRALAPPLLLVANHQSALDAPAILRALPRRLRASVAFAMGPVAARHRSALVLFGGFLLPEGGGLPAALAHMGRLADDGRSVLVFPEGARTRDGSLAPFRPGIGVIAAEMGLPVVPIALDGLFDVLPHGAGWPRRGIATVRFLAPYDPRGKAPAAITADLEARVRESSVIRSRTGGKR